MLEFLYVWSMRHGRFRKSVAVDRALAGEKKLCYGMTRFCYGVLLWQSSRNFLFGCLRDGFHQKLLQNRGILAFWNLASRNMQPCCDLSESERSPTIQHINFVQIFILSLEESLSDVVLSQSHKASESADFMVLFLWHLVPPASGFWVWLTFSRFCLTEIHSQSVRFAAGVGCYLVPRQHLLYASEEIRIKYCSR